MSPFSFWTAIIIGACWLVSLSSAGVYIVVDVDGAAEDFAVLTTILRHSTARTQLSLITINGNGWGSMKTVEANVRRFLQLAGRLDTVGVAIGRPNTLDDVYNQSTRTANCLGTQGIPLTPQDASTRGMKVSRYDVNRAFGMASSLPKLPASILSASTDAVTAFLNLLQSMTQGEKIQFISLSSLTTFSEIITKAKDFGMYNNLVQMVELHSYENGNNWALDRTATNMVFQSSPNLVKYLYAPQLWKSSVTFSIYNWDLFEKAATKTSTSVEVAWLYRVWKAKKTMFDSISNTAFFQERGPASSLIALCVVDATTSAMCAKYRNTNSTAMLSWSNSTYTATTSSGGSVALTYDALSGNNVTNFMFLQYPATTTTATTTTAVLGGLNYIADVSAAQQWPSTSQSLVTLFWSRWTAILSA